MSISLERLESTSLRELSLLLRQDTKNKKLSDITITEVRITRDLSYMNIYYTFYNGNKEAYQQALEDSKGYIRKELAKRIKARKMPELVFKYDESLAYGNHIEELIHQYHEKHDEADAKNNIDEN